MAEGAQADHYPSLVPSVLRAPSARPVHTEHGDPTSKDNRDRMVDLRPVTPLSPINDPQGLRHWDELGYGSIRL